MPVRNPHQTRDRLLGVAEREFASHGFAGARVARICRRARVNQRMLYHYFGSKRGLYKAVYLKLTSRVVDQLQAELSPVETEDARGILASFVRAVTKVLAQRPSYSRILLHEALDGFGMDDEINREGDPGIPVRTAILNAIRRGQDSDARAEPDMVVDAVALTVVFALVYPVFKSRFADFLDARGVRPADRDAYVADRIARLLSASIAQR